MKTTTLPLPLLLRRALPRRTPFTGASTPGLRSRCGRLLLLAAALGGGGVSPPTFGQSLNINSSNSPYVMDGTAQHPAGNFGTIAIGFPSSSAGELDQSGGVLTVSGSLIVGENSPGTYNLSGGSLVASGNFTVGQQFSGGGTFNLSGTGTATTTANTQIDSSMVQTGGIFDATGASLMLLGNVRAGTLTINAGLFKAGTLYMSSSANSTLNLNGGTLQAAEITRYNLGATQTFNLNGGTLQAGTDNANFLHDLSIANVRNGGGIIDANGHNFTISQPLVHSTVNGDNAIDGGLTKNGSGTLTVTGANTYNGGTTVNAGTLTVGTGGTLGASSGALTVNNLNTGAGTDVVMNLSTTAGTTVGTLSGSIATPSNGTNTATINNGGQLLTINQGSDAAFAGAIAGGGGLTKNGLGSLTVTGGSPNTYTGDTTVTAGSMILAKLDQGATTNFGSAMAGNLVINSGATVRYGASNQVRDDKKITVAGTLDLAGNSDSISNLAVNGGSITTGAGYLQILGNVTSDGSSGSSITGQLALSGTRSFSVSFGGTLAVAASITDGTNLVPSELIASGSGTLALSGINSYSGGTNILGGTLAINSDAALGASSKGILFQVGGGTLRTDADLTSSRAIDSNSSTINTAGHTVIWNGQVSGSDFLKSGAGSLTLTATNNYSGSTTVNAGALLVSGSITSPTTVNSGATLGGTGHVGGVTVLGTSPGGTVDPGATTGNSTGRLSTGAFSLNSGAHLTMQLGGVTAGAASGGYDQISAAGLTLGGDLTISFLGGYTPNFDDTFFLVTNSGAAPSGTFSSISTPSGYTAAVNYAASAGDGTNGNDVSITFTGVPEPGTWALSISGFTLLLGGQRRRRKLQSTPV